MSQLMVTPRTADKTAAATAAIHRQLRELKRAAAVSSMDNELFIAAAILINNARDMIDGLRLEDAYEFVDGVKFIAIHMGDAKLEHAARATRKMILWTIAHMGGSA